jgi:hypothetical protein
LRDNKPNFKELQVHEELTSELLKKPMSFLSKLVDPVTASKKKIDFTKEEKKETCVLPLS